MNDKCDLELICAKLTTSETSLSFRYVNTLFSFIEIHVKVRLYKNYLCLSCKNLDGALTLKNRW